MKNYCDQCQLVVAPSAPDRIKYGKRVMHAECFKRYLKNRPIRIEQREVINISAVNAAAEEAHALAMEDNLLHVGLPVREHDEPRTH